MGVWSEKIAICAKEKFGIAHLFPIQQLVIHNILEALFPKEDKDYYKNQLIILPTGMGKSVCFQIPASFIDTPTIIVYPLLSLINDQLRRLNEAGVCSFRIVGGMTHTELKEAKNALDAGTCRCILTNPESLENTKHQKLLLKYKPEFVVIDESHCISKWGNSFRNSYLNIGQLVKGLNAKVVVAFTATASEVVINDIKKFLFLDDEMHTLQGHANRENITYSVLYCTDREHSLVELCKHKSNEEEEPSINLPIGTYEVHDGTHAIKRPAIVFCSTRSECSRLALKLRYELSDNHINFYHAGLSKEEKHKIEEWFLHSKDGILVATCAYGMGVDKSDIKTVIHIEPFSDIENFLQETGRAGRDRSAAQSIMLADMSPKQLEHDSKLKCRRAYYMNALGLECEGCTGCDKCVGLFPIYDKVYTSIVTILTIYPRCFDTMSLLQHIVTYHKKRNIMLDYADSMFVLHSIKTLISHGIIKTGRCLWRGKLYVTNNTRIF